MKKQVFAELDQIRKPDVILASNTSTLDIDEIASATSTPRARDRPSFLQLRRTSCACSKSCAARRREDVIATSMALAKRLKKVGVLVGNCRGFVGNRMFHQYQREAQFLVEEGAQRGRKSTARFTIRHGHGAARRRRPGGTRRRLADPQGIPASGKARRCAPPGRGSPVRVGPLRPEDRRGLVRYNERPQPEPRTPKSKQSSRSARKRAGIAAGGPSRPEEIIERTIYALVNEGARILEEGFALRAVDIDIIYINGYGFPAYRGGPMWYADTVGLKKVYERIYRFPAATRGVVGARPAVEAAGRRGKDLRRFRQGEERHGRADAG